MTEVVKAIKDAFPRREWNVWTRGAIGDVHYNRLVTDIDGLEMKSRPSFPSEFLEFWVQSLFGGDSTPI